MDYTCMNSTQKLISDISGFCGLDESGARDDGYYEINDILGKLHYLIDVVAASDTISGVDVDICKAQKFLDKEFTSANEKIHEFNEL